MRKLVHSRYYAMKSRRFIQGAGLSREAGCAATGIRSMHALPWRVGAVINHPISQKPRSSAVLPWAVVRSPSELCDTPWRIT